MTQINTVSRLPRGSRMLIPSAIILFFGISIGLSSALVFSNTIMPAPENRTVGATTRSAAQIVAELKTKQNWSDAESATLEAVYAARLSAIRAIQQDAQQRISAQHEALRDDVRNVLSPAQFDRWDAQFQVVRSRHWARHATTPPTTVPTPDPTLPLPSLEDVFQRFDGNADGVIQRDELPAPLRERLMRADADADGTVTRHELLDARERMR